MSRIRVKWVLAASCAVIAIVYGYYSISYHSPDWMVSPPPQISRHNVTYHYGGFDTSDEFRREKQRADLNISDDGHLWPMRYEVLSTTHNCNGAPVLLYIHWSDGNYHVYRYNGCV